MEWLFVAFEVKRRFGVEEEGIKMMGREKCQWGERNSGNLKHEILSKIAKHKRMYVTILVGEALFQSSSLMSLIIIIIRMYSSVRKMLRLWKKKSKSRFMEVKRKKSSPFNFGKYFITSKKISGVKCNIKIKAGYTEEVFEILTGD